SELDEHFFLVDAHYGRPGRRLWPGSLVERRGDRLADGSFGGGAAGHDGQLPDPCRRGGLGIRRAFGRARLAGTGRGCAGAAAGRRLGLAGRGRMSRAVNQEAKGRTRKGKPRGIRQTMSELHIWTGLLVGWILYAMFLTGTISYFRDEVSRYMRPELVGTPSLPAPAQTVQNVLDAVREQGLTLRQISISLPSGRQPAASAFWSSPDLPGRGFGTGVFDAATGQAVQASETRGGDFFYAFHFNFHYMPGLWARWVAGLCAMFMLVAIVSGVITHKKIFTDFFTFRWGKG